jgi:hypothetical protein
MKKLTPLLKLLVFIVLFLLPLAVRWFWYYRGKYETPNIAPINPARITTYAEKYVSYIDQPQLGRGRVVIDLSHDNNLLVDDLTPLKTRLAVRGVEVQIYDSTAADNLATRLRGATALVELVPTQPFEPEDRQVILDFINDGGRLLVAADPTRPVPSYGNSDSIDLNSVFFPESAIPAVNSLANALGISYFEDYVYNLSDYDANYRNVKFQSFSADSSLTKGLNQVTLFAAHSLRGDGIPLITGDQNTLSNVRAGETGFVTAMLAKDGKVLALGDITFMTSPYYQVSDNDHFLCNIADWLATDSRQWDLKDFPYLFTGQVDLIQSFTEAVDPRLIVQSTPLQGLFTQSGIQLALRTKADPEDDAFYIGTYAKLDPVKSFLTEANITITFSTTQTTTVMTATQGQSNTEVNQVEEKPKDTIEVKDLGLFLAQGSSLYLVNRSGNHLSMIVLAEDEESSLKAIQRLLDANFDGCVNQQDVTICSTGEIPTTPEPPQEGGGGPKGGGTGNVEPATLPSVLIVSIDNGLNGKRNDASDITMALTGLYEVTIWSAKSQGIPTESDLTGYDVYIVETGDYAYDDEVGKVMDSVSNLKKVLLIGEQPFSTEGGYLKTAQIADLVVADANHPLAFMFSEGETIPLSASESGNPAIVLPKDLFINTDTASVVFERGSSSEEAGAVAVFAYEDTEGYRYAIATFAFYRLPIEKQFTFIHNAVEWLNNK